MMAENDLLCDISYLEAIRETRDLTGTEQAELEGLYEQLDQIRE